MIKSITPAVTLFFAITASTGLHAFQIEVAKNALVPKQTMICEPVNSINGSALECRIATQVNSISELAWCTIEEDPILKSIQAKLVSFFDGMALYF